MPPVLRCEGLRKRFGDRTAVDGVGFQIGAGECSGLLVPNGAGETTTICGLLEGEGGAVEVDGRSLHDDGPAVRGDIGFVPQEIALYPDPSAEENLRLFGRLYGLSDRAGDRIEECSGGMKRRANLAAGLLHDPKLLVLDELTVGVDPQSRQPSSRPSPAPCRWPSRAVHHALHGGGRASL